MRTTASAASALTLLPSVAFAAEQGEKVNLLSPSYGLMFWTLLIFIVLLFILSRYAFKPILAAVEAREASLEQALQQAKSERAEAAKLLEEQRAKLEAARGEAQTLIAEGRLIAEKLKASMLDETRTQQQELTERARRELESEKVKAIAELRREAVDLAIAGAGKVIEKNLDDAGNRRLVEEFLASLPASPTRTR